MPGPQTSRTPAAGGSGRWQVSTSTRAASAAAISCSFSSAARGAPSTRLTGTRSPMPCTSHQALRCTVSGTAGPFRRSSQCWSSSIDAPSYGSTDSTAGPPDAKRNSRGPSSVPFSGFQPGEIARRQATPGGSVRSRSQAHSRSLIQRRLPAGALPPSPSQASTAGSGSAGDPNGTTAVSKRRRICTAADTSPLGTADTTRAPQADPAAAASAAISTPPSRPRHRRPPGRSVSCRCPSTRFLLHAGPSPRVVQSRSGSSRPANLSAGPASPPWCATSRSWCANRRASRRTGRDHG